MIKGGKKGMDQVFYTCPQCGMTNLFNLPKEWAGELRNLKVFKGAPPCANCNKVSRANEWMKKPLTEKDSKRIAEREQANA